MASAVVVGFAACSCFGDLLVLLTRCGLAHTRPNFSVRYVTHLAMADLAVSIIGIFNNSGARAGCKAEAAALTQARTRTKTRTRTASCFGRLRRHSCLG